MLLLSHVIISDPMFDEVFAMLSHEFVCMQQLKADFRGALRYNSRSDIGEEFARGRRNSDLSSTPLIDPTVTLDCVSERVRRPSRHLC